MDEIEKQTKQEAAVAARQQSESETYLAQNKAKPGVMVTASGLQYEIVRKGDESIPPPAATDMVNVNYEGTLPNGKVFDSSYARNEPAQFEVGGVIRGWTEALQIMHPGSEFRLVIPSDLAYGPEGSPPEIPPNQVLIFKVELLGYMKPDGTKVGKY
jgi:FKBP-type peptidyl-prolyl cis-trans isomerase